MDIPYIGFNHNKSNQAELEIISQQSLYQAKGFCSINWL